MAAHKATQKAISRPGRPAAYRLWRIHMEIQRGNYPNTQDLADKLEVSHRTVERDLSYLRDMFQAPLQYDPNRRGFFYNEPSFSLPPLELSEGEITALAVAARLMAQDLHTPIAPVVERVLQRLVTLMPGKLLMAPGDLEQALSFGPDAGAAAAGLVRQRFEQIMAAITSKTTLRAVYYSASRDVVTSRDIDPYTLYHADGNWYVIGFCHWRRKILIFALHRFKEVTDGNRRFDIPSDYSPKEFMGHAWRAWRGQTATVELRFEPAVTTLVAERRWHPSQQLVPQDDGSLIMRLQVDGLEEITRWILSWGASCKVLGPDRLRHTLAKHIETMAGYYEPQ